MVALLFGDSWNLDQLINADNDMAFELVGRVRPEDANFDVARAFLRSEILRARARVPKDTALAIAELHLAWLTTAQEQGVASCREVTSGTFAQGEPQMREDWVRFEQSLAAGLLATGGFKAPQSEPAAEPIPRWVISDAAARYEIDELTILNALGDPASTNRCAVEIAVLQAMLARPDDVTPGILAAI